MSGKIMLHGLIGSPILKTDLTNVKEKLSKYLNELNIVHDYVGSCALNPDDITVDYKFGDIDLLISENDMKELMDKLNPDTFQELQEPSNKDFDLIGIHAKSNARIKYALFRFENKTIQVDFISYENEKKREFLKWSHSASAEDINVGLKGIFHKYLLRALISAIEEVYIDGKKDSMFTFSVDYGIRAKYDEAGNKTKGNYYYALNGYDELLADSAGFIQTLANLMNSNIDSGDLERVNEYFFSILFGIKSQRISTNFEYDFKSKCLAYQIFINAINLYSTTMITDFKFVEIAEYYEKNKTFKRGY